MSHPRELKILCRSSKDKALHAEVEIFADKNELTIAAALRFLVRQGLDSLRFKVAAEEAASKRKAGEA